MLWTLSQWSDPDLTGEISALFHGEVTSAGQSFSFWQRAEGIDALNRLVGFIIISSLPSAGVWDALDVLTEVYETHQARLPAIPAASRVRAVRGRIVSKETRPGTLLSE